MKKPVSRILLINDEPLILKEFVKGLNAAAKSMENPFCMTFTGVTTAQEAIEQDGDIQALVVDDRLYDVATLNHPVPDQHAALAETHRSAWHCL